MIPILLLCFSFPIIFRLFSTRHFLIHSYWGLGGLLETTLPHNKILTDWMNICKKWLLLFSSFLPSSSSYMWLVCYQKRRKKMRRIYSVDIIKPCTVFAFRTRVRALGTAHPSKWSYKMKHFQLTAHKIIVIIIHDTHCCTVSLSLIVIKKNFNLTWNCLAHTHTPIRLLQMNKLTNEFVWKFIQFYEISGFTKSATASGFDFVHHTLWLCAQCTFCTELHCTSTGIQSLGIYVFLW